MESETEKLYKKLFNTYKDATNKAHKVCDTEVSKIWKSLKKSKDFPENVKPEIQRWKSTLESRRRKIDDFFVTKIF